MKGKAAVKLVDENWFKNEFIPTVQQRGAAMIKARGLSSAASAASAAIDHMRDWALGTPKGSWVSMGVASDGSYGIKPGIIYGYPVTCSKGQWKIVKGLKIGAFSQERMRATETELREEREGVKDFAVSCSRAETRPSSQEGRTGQLLRLFSLYRIYHMPPNVRSIDMARVEIELPESFPSAVELEVRVSDLNYGNHLGNDAVLDPAPRGPPPLPAVPRAATRSAQTARVS